MQAGQRAPPPLAPLWERVVRARALPPDVDVPLLYRAIRERLARPEGQVRLHALRVLADLLPLSGNALSFPFDQAVDNLGHASPNVRKAALDALKVFCSHCEEPECAARAILDKCYYHNIRPSSADLDAKLNVITGLILSIPSLMSILKRRNANLDTFPVYQILGEKLFDPVHRDVAYRALMKLRKVNGPREYMISISRLDPKIQEKFRFLCENYDEDSLDVYYAPRKTIFMEDDRPVISFNGMLSRESYAAPPPVTISSDSSSEDSLGGKPVYNNNFAKVIMETEIKFDSDTAITMTVLEESDSDSERRTATEDEYDSSDRNQLRYSDCDSEDSDVVVKRVRFGGEIVKIRTPESDNLIGSDDDPTRDASGSTVTRPVEQGPKPSSDASEVTSESSDTHEQILRQETQTKTLKKSGIPLPVIRTKPKSDVSNKYKDVKLKSKSLSELYDYFRSKNDTDGKAPNNSGLSLTLSEVRSPEKVPGPVEPHREVEVLHNLQREPTISPRSQRNKITLDKDGFVVSLLASSSPPPAEQISPHPPAPLQPRYEWEALEIIPQHVIEQLHNTEDWVGAVKAADQLHRALLEPATVRRVEPAALSLIEHMFALSDAVAASRAPAEGAVCAVVRGCSAGCARRVLAALVPRLARDPPPAALPHALLHRLALHHLVDLIFDPELTPGDAQEAEERALRSTLCLSRAAGPAAVLAAVRRRLAGTKRADRFCNKLRERLSRPLENIKPSSYSSRSQAAVGAARARRARSTPPPACARPARLRPLHDSAPLLGPQPPRECMVKPLSPIPLSDKETSARLASNGNENESPTEKVEAVEGDEDRGDPLASRDSSLETGQARSPRIEDYSEEASPRASPASAPADEAATPTRSGDDSSPHRSSGPEPEPEPGPRPAEPPTERGAARDVRGELAQSTLPARHEDWEAVVAGLARLERLAGDARARAPAGAWRAAARGAAAHVRSLRSRVARAACLALAALFEHRARPLDPELEEAVSALLDRCADVNRFLRADAGAALTRVACGATAARGAAALCRRGAAHRSGLVRAAAAAALAQLVRREGAARTLALPAEVRALVVRCAGELALDASAEARAQARRVCAVLAQEARFRPLLQEALPPSRYRALDKLLDRLPAR